jgi:hypothetical protein
MKLFTIALVIFFFTAISTDGFYEDKHENGQVKVQCHIENGIFDGQYKSWYKNGTKKISGKFSKNQRVGQWNVWSETGELLMQRDYINNFQFEVNNIASPEKSITTKVKLDYNDFAYIAYDTIYEKDVLWAKKSWRIIKPSELNMPLFENNKLFKVINKSLKENSIQAYSAEQDIEGKFKIALKTKELDDLVEIRDDKLIGFLVKEESVIDKRRQILETRIIGICPIVYDKNDRPKHLFWVYFPNLRPILAKERVEYKSYLSNINTLDDVFYYKNYNSQLYKVTNVTDSPIFIEDKDAVNTLQKLELETIEREHESWFMAINGKI